MAVAAAAAMVGSPDGPPAPETLLDGVIALVPKSAVGQGLRRAHDMLDHGDAAAVLGCGRRTAARYILWKSLTESWCHLSIRFCHWRPSAGLQNAESSTAGSW
jgi:hypothetical protein